MTGAGSAGTAGRGFRITSRDETRHAHPTHRHPRAPVRPSSVRSEAAWAHAVAHHTPAVVKEGR